MARRKPTPMRDQVARLYTDKMAQCLRVVNMIKDIPAKVPIYFEVEQYFWNERATKILPVAAIILKFNPGSIRVEFIVDTSKYGHKDSVGALRYEEIRSWRLLTDADLPLLIGSSHTSSLFDAMLKDFDAYKDAANRYQKEDKSCKTCRKHGLSSCHHYHRHTYCWERK